MWWGESFILAFLQWWLLTHPLRLERRRGRFWTFATAARKFFIWFYLLVGLLNLLNYAREFLPY